jgi:hypothetical protein
MSQKSPKLIYLLFAIVLFVTNASAQNLQITDTAAMLSGYKTYFPRTAFSLTTTGSSGSATYNPATGVFNIPQYHFIPYTGATGPVDLGGYDMIVNGITIGRGAGNISNSIAFGPGALATGNTAQGNVAIGYNALNVNTSGQGNSGIGFNALRVNTTGTLNLAIGVNAMYNNVNGTQNMAFGNSALFYNVYGNDNVGIGQASLLNTTSNSNVGIGSYSLFSNNIGRYNIGIGTNAGYEVTTGAQNTMIGYNTGRGITGGNYNTIIGANVTGLTAGLSNNIIIADGIGNIKYQYNGTTNKFTGSLTQTTVVSALPKLDANGTIVAAVAGTDYQAPITITTIGTVGAATLSGTVLNIPQYNTVVDSLIFSTRMWRQKAVDSLNGLINQRLQLSDSAEMLSGYAKNGQVVHYSDMSSMLSAYATTESIPNVSGKVNYTDTASIVAGYAKNGQVVHYDDVASILSGYATTELIPNIAGKVNYSDTSLMLNGYAKAGQVVRSSDLTAMLSTYAQSGQLSNYLLLTGGVVNGNIDGTTARFSGEVVAKKLTVRVLPWSDYVFDANYQLKSLADVASFIKLNKHLPDVPSAKEVEEKGVSIGDNQAILLRKIEELTLYVIKQQEEINELRKSMKRKK